MSLDLKPLEVLKDDEWQPIPFRDLRKGDRFRWTEEPQRAFIVDCDPYVFSVDATGQEIYGVGVKIGDKR